MVVFIINDTQCFGMWLWILVKSTKLCDRAFCEVCDGASSTQLTTIKYNPKKTKYHELKLGTEYIRSQNSTETFYNILQ